MGDENTEKIKRRKRRRKKTEGDARRGKETEGRREVRFCRSIETGVANVWFCGH